MAVKGNWAFILNPVAGNGFAGDYINVVEDKIKNYKVQGEIFLTHAKGHARTLSGELAEKGYDHIVAVGGDGTINEVAFGLVDKQNVTFGAVAAGTGNDFIQVLGFTEYFSERDWEIFFEVNQIKMDIGQCNDNYFFNGMGLGFDAQVAAENYTPDNEAKSGSKSKYLWHIVKNLMFFDEKIMYLMENDQKSEITFFMNTIAIGRRFAGGYYLTPNALANDGLLDVCMVGDLNIGGRINLFMKVPKGAHIGHPKVTYYQTDKLIIEFDDEVPHHLDGELFFAKNFEIQILPQSMNTIYNPYGNHFFAIT
jgi:diacylglycerol kinase (ATP)